MWAGMILMATTCPVSMCRARHTLPIANFDIDPTRPNCSDTIVAFDRTGVAYVMGASYQFPTFVAGILASDSLGRIDVDAVGVPIECGGVTVNAGDLVLADCDGVVVLPVEVADEAIALAEEKFAGESVVREKLAEGMPVWDAFRTYGVI